MSALFSGTIYFAHVTFATPGQNFSVSAADMQTMITYARHAIVPISEWVPQYGPSTVAISPNSIEFTANMSSTSFTDSDLQGWVNSIVSSNGLDPTSTAIVVPCPAQISESAGEGIGPNSGYHFIANVPYAVWGMGGTNITLADEADVYAMVVSHEISELIVDPQGNLSNPEVCDPCCENCEGVPGSYSGGFFRAYFDIFNDYLGTNQQTPPGGFSFAYYNAVIVKPAGAEYSDASDCDATTADCNYAPVNQNFYFVIEQDDYGRDEVNDNPTFPLAFYLFLEGFSPSAVGTTTFPDFTGSFNNTNIPGLSITHTGTTYDIGDTGANGNIPQRIRFEYQVGFTTASLAAFPLAGNPPNPFSLLATISVQGQNIPFNPQGEFFLLGGADPYFTNVNNTSGNQPYLSQDLRVFTATPAVNNTPVTGGPALSDSVGGAYSYITSLITYLNQTYGYLNTNYTPPDTNISDPLDSLLPSQIATEGDSLVTQVSGSNNNYNFAIARVRLRAASTAAPASNVKVFFRLFTTQTFDTDFIDQNTPTTSADPNITYPSSGAPDPESPLPGTDGNHNINGCSLPFFANANFVDGPNDYSTTGINNQTIVMPSMHDYAWAFYGCFLNVWDNANTYGGSPVQHWMPGSGHSCLVAQIAYDDAPIVNAGGVLETPESNDKLAQRNLQVNHSGNPVPATHHVPQSIDARPSPPPASTDPTSILSYPDEIMIDWGATPIGTLANIYWPAVSASSVLQLAAQLYSGHMLTAADAHTIQCKVVSPVTYVPIPTGTGGSFAGLITVDLPNGIKIGNEFNIVARRITTRQLVLPPSPPPPPPIQRGKTKAAVLPATAIKQPLVWRYIAGSFLMKIQVQKESKILPVDENLLAVLKWRLGLIGMGNRWYPVLVRWISVLSSRITAMGQDPGKIPASPKGYQPPSIGKGQHQGQPGARHECCYTGKVAELFYDCFGDFEGFELKCCACEQHSFRSCEPDLEELIYLAWTERFVITVCVCRHDAHKVESVALLRTPRH
jgi:hypothetical protein